MPLNPFAAQIARHNTALPTLANTDTSELQLDSSGRLIIAVSGNTIAIDDNGGSITVDGTVTVDSITNDVNVTQGTSPWVVSNGGTFAVQEDGAALTALQLIDDVVFAVDDAAGGTDAGNNVLAIRDDALTTLTPADGDYVSLRVNAEGALWAEDVNSADMLTALQLLDNIVANEDAAAGDAFTGVPMLAVRQDTLANSTDADDDFAALKVDNDGALYVTGTFNAAVDDVFESGTEADSASDSAGDGAVSANNSTMTDVAVLAVGAGVTAYIVGLDISADDQVRYELIIDDNGTPTEWLRAGAIDGVVSHNKTFPRAIEITGAADRQVQLRAQSLQSATANVAGAINAYTR